ncbi:DUF7693 family protein [Pseudomonas silesiensis]
MMRKASLRRGFFYAQKNKRAIFDTVRIAIFLLPLPTPFNDCDILDYCEYCRSPDGQVGTLELWQREESDPVDLLSAWEREQLERLLAAL